MLRGNGPGGLPCGLIAAAAALALLAGCARRAPAPRPAPPKPAPPAAHEVCGNCVDDDGNGRVDYEEQSCCPQRATLEPTGVRVVKGQGRRGQLRLDATLPAQPFADANPLLDDVTFQLRDGRELLCATIRHEFWTKKHRNFRFQDARGRRTGGVTSALLSVAHDGGMRFAVESTGIDASRFAQPELTVTVRIGDRCASGTVHLHRVDGDLAFP